MVILHVYVHVKAGCADAFIAATRKNVAGSLAEPGVLRFDLMREAGDPDKFELIEVYRDEQAPLSHKETAHYQAWRVEVEAMMAAPRRSTRLVPVEPGDERGWRSERA